MNPVLVSNLNRMGYELLDFRHRTNDIAFSISFHFPQFQSRIRFHQQMDTSHFGLKQWIFSFLHSFSDRHALSLCLSNIEKTNSRSFSLKSQSSLSVLHQFSFVLQNQRSVFRCSQNAEPSFHADKERDISEHHILQISKKGTSTVAFQAFDWIHNCNEE